MKKVFIDSDVFVRDLRYPRDQRSPINRRFLEKVRAKKIHAVTSIFNLLEVCGILSFNLSQEQLLGLYADFCQHYKIQLLFPADPNADLLYKIPEVFVQIQKSQSLGDAQISYVVQRFQDQLACFVSWNAAHFQEKLSIPTKTPEELI